MDIRFREYNAFDLWIWLRFETVPSIAERNLVEEMFDSWFFIGKLGGFNAENLQIQDEGLDLSYMEYSDDRADNTLMALMHNMGDVEFEGIWARCWFDLGTSDAIALDILANMLKQFSKDFVVIEELIIGGENEDWLAPQRPTDTFVDVDA